MTRQRRGETGRHLWGQGTLLARRLVESGVRFVTVNLHGDPPFDVNPPFSWDTHSNNFPAMKDHLLPVFDQLFSALVEDLEQRGLLDKVLIVAVGEFGRAPKIEVDTITKKGGPGRTHWPQAFSAVLAGGGLRMGQVIGSTDAKGMAPKDRPLLPEDLLATVYRHLGIDSHSMIRDNLNRPIPILPGGEPIRELI